MPRRGQHLSVEARQKLSAARKGKPNLFLAQFNREVLGPRSKGVPRPDLRAEKNGMYGKKRPDLVDLNHKRYLIGYEHPWLGRKHRTESIERMRAAKRGKQYSEESKEKRRQAMLKIWEEWRKNPELLTERNRKVSEGKKGDLNPLRNARVLKTVLLSRAKRPTKPEKLFMQIIEEYGLPYKYVGDGQVVIGHMCPDFINVDGTKIVVEIFGNYFHTEEEVEPKREEYNKYGFNCLVIWQDELKDKEAVVKKLREENNG